MLVEPPQARDTPEELLVHRPQVPRTDHRAVVEADRCERAPEVVDGGEQIALERAQHVLSAYLYPLACGLHAHAHVRHAVDPHHAVGAPAGAAEQSATAVVLEAAREDSPAGREQGGADRVALERLDGTPLKEESDGSRAIDPLLRLGRQPHQVAGVSGTAASCGAEIATASPRAGSSVLSTSLVRVSRSARNQSSQPKRWYHHSRCTPATLRRKYT